MRSGEYVVGSAQDSADRCSLEWLAGGQMGRLVRSFDWASTPLGLIQVWPQSLRSALSICLGSRFPIVIYWGSDLVVLYNDAYAEILGKKHPSALGRPCREVWSEIWDVIGPMLDRVLTTGDATWSEDQLLLLERRGYLEECYFSFSFSPVCGADGKVDGIFTAVIENTRRVLGERRLRTLRDLGVLLAEAKSAEAACGIAANTLAGNRADIPFASLYLVDKQTRRGSLVANTGTDNGVGAPISFDLDGADHVGGWPLAFVCRTGETVAVEQLPGSALILPLATAGESHCAGVIVTGVSPRRELDQEYRDFFELIARRIAAAIAEARTYEAERRRAEALAEIDRAKTAFFSNVSHEFRTPLTLLLGPIEELKREFGCSSSPLSASHCQQLDLMHRNALRLLKLTNTLLDFSRIQAGRVQAVYEPTDIAAYTAELASVFRSAIEKAGLKLVVECPALAEPAYIDREMWEKIVLNLVSNAFKFTFSGEIEVKLRTTSSHFELIVRDTGTGIPADEVPRLFERFHRIAGAHGRTNEGSGIGLALVQELAQLHGGSVAIESTYGKGSALRVLLPRGRTHLPTDQIRAARTQASTRLGTRPFLEEALRWVHDAAPDDERVINDVAAPEHIAGQKGEHARILLVDDNADMREYVRRLLGARYEVEAVTDGEAALAAIDKRVPDLVLSDIMMPRLDGLELLGHLRTDPRTKTLPIILLSARAGEDSRAQGLAAGADDYLVKPFSARELLARVAGTLKIAQVRREAEQALRESEARFRHMADNAPVMVRVTERDGSCTFLSQSWYDFTGQIPETGLGVGWLDAVHPDDRGSAHDSFVVANAKGEVFRLEYRLRRKDGEYVWMIDAAAPRRGAGGEFLGYIGSVIDISERKRAEERQQLLVNELNHRVKNTLASVQAIAQQTLRRTKDTTEFAVSFGGRIQSLARAHSLLSNSAWQSADLRELIRDQLLLGPIDETRVTTWGPAVSLEPQMALHLALMLHELATNSIKHGALSGVEGAVTVSWRLEDQRLHLQWAEYSGPLVTLPTKRGFGTTLIEQSARAEGGSARLSVESNGVIWHIALPLPDPAALEGSFARTSAALLRRGPLREVPTAEGPHARLAGKRFLVVEDEPLIGLDIVAGLEQAGAKVVGLVGTVEEVLQSIESASFDGALLDANLRGRPVDEVASALARRNVAFLFVSGYGREGLPSGFARTAMLAKPFTQQQLLEAAAQLIRQPGVVVGLRN